MYKKVIAGASSGAYLDLKESIAMTQQRRARGHLAEQIFEVNVKKRTVETTLKTLLQEKSEGKIKDVYLIGYDIHDLVRPLNKIYISQTKKVPFCGYRSLGSSSGGGIAVEKLAKGCVLVVEGFDGNMYVYKFSGSKTSDKIIKHGIQSIRDFYAEKERKSLVAQAKEDQVNRFINNCLNAMKAFDNVATSVDLSSMMQTAVSNVAANHKLQVQLYGTGYQKRTMLENLSRLGVSSG